MEPLPRNSRLWLLQDARPWPPACELTYETPVSVHLSGEGEQEATAVAVPLAAVRASAPMSTRNFFMA